MARLTDKQRWDDLYKKGEESTRRSMAGPDVRQKGIRKYISSYSDYFLWNVIFEKNMPKVKGAKILEVGSAPGRFLIRLHKEYGYVPFGVEYSEQGVAQNKKVFSLHNIDPDNVIHADFFDINFQDKYRGFFDVVISRGFIEHFTDVEDVVEKHVNLLVEGGCLIISIPNLSRQGIYGACSPLLDKKRLDMHNLNIMTESAFAELFKKKLLSEQYCGYYGTLSLNMLSASEALLSRLVVSACCRLQTFLNPLLYFLFRQKGAESKYFSPMLLYIGKKMNSKIGKQ